MATLFIDLGNSRTKFAIKKRKNLELLQTVSNEVWSDDELAHQVFNQLPEKVKAVYIASVAPKFLESKLNVYLMKFLHLIPTYLQVQKACCGISTRYEPFYQLGVDRWLSVLGAYSLYESNLTVIDLGTAITSDTLIDQVHLGGFITPGLKLQQQSILEHTGIQLSMPLEMPLAENADAEEQPFFSTNTAPAILGGTHLMTVAYLNHLMAEIINHYQQSPHLFILTGGDAKQIEPMLQYETEREENLVFIGMDYLIGSL